MAYVINRLNRNVIGQFKSDFNTEYDRTKNSYTKFNSSFMFNCSDAYITQMRKKIVDYYNTIGYLYNSLNDWWNAYNYNLNHIENAIIEKNSGFVTETSIKTAIKQLPALRDFRFNLNSFTIPDDYVANFNKIKTVDKIEDNIKDKTSNPLEFSFNFVKGNINAIKEVAKDKTLDFIAENETVANIAMFATGVVGETYANSSEIFSEYGAYAVANFYSNQMKGYSLFSGNEYNMQDDEFLQKIQGFIDKDYSGEAFDSFYKNNEFGKTIYENSTITDKTREFQKQIQSIQEKAAATSALAGISVTEGLVGVGEKILDAGSYVVGAVASVVAPESGADEAISDFIEQELTTDHFNWLQDNTLLGAEIKEEAVAQELVRGVGNAVGEIAGILGISALTGGAVQPWAVAGVSGFGGGVEDAFQSGADYSEAGLYGLAVGGFDALQWYVGGAIESSIRSKFARVAIDSGLNFADMPIRSEFKAAFLGDEYKNELLKSINYDENGNQIANKTWDDLTFYEQCKLAYEADGGHAAMITNGVLGTVLSAAGEFSDIGKYFTKDNRVVDTSIFDVLDSNIKDPSLNDLTLNLDELKYKKVGNIQYVADYLDANIKKFVYNDTSKFEGLNESIIENGLIHFTSENAANSILKSQKINSSGYTTSYGNKKSFLFNGIPDVGNIAVNLDGVKIKMVGIEIQPTWYAVLNSRLKVRNLADQCITWNGDFDLMGQKVSKGYYCLFQEGDELVYKKVSKNFYDNYDNTDIGKKLKEFVSDKSNVKNIADDHLSTYVHRSTGSKVTDSLESAVKKVNDTKVTEFSNVSDVANYFNDPKQYAFQKLRNYVEQNPNNVYLINYYNTIQSKPIAFIDELELYNVVSTNNILSNQEFAELNSIYTRMNGNSIQLSDFEKDCINVYTKYSGPAITARLRNAKSKYKAKVNGKYEIREFDGTNPMAIQNYVDRSWKEVLGENGPSLEKICDCIDDIIRKSDALPSDLVVYRGVDELFENGNKIDLGTIKPGTKFNDSAYLSASVIPTSISSSRNIELKITLPKGTKSVYLEKYTGVARYNQQELLLPRNSQLEVTSYPKYDASTGKIFIEAKLIQDDINGVVGQLGLKNITQKNMSTNYFNNFAKQYEKNSIDVSDFYNRLSEKGLLNRYNLELEDIKKNNLYPYNIKEHSVDHVERVMLYSMYMGDEVNLNTREMNLLIEASKYHDSGRVNVRTDKEHGALSGKRVYNELVNYDIEERKIMAAAVEYHELNGDGYEALQPLFHKYQIVDSSSQETVLKIGNILKDADAIDRVRFPGNLKVDRFRNQELAVPLLKTAYQMQEIRGNIELTDRINNNLLNQNTNENDWINYWRQLGISDYEIDFALKYNRVNLLNQRYGIE